MNSDVEKKLAAARARLILDKPFLGALVLRLPLVPANPDWCPTTATDARSIFYCEQYINDLNVSQVQFLLAHEALHCALSHFARRRHRERQRWDVACDFAVNPLLLADDLEAPPGALFDKNFEGMTAEEIYPCLEGSDEQEPLDRHVYAETGDVGTFGAQLRSPTTNAAQTGSSMDGGDLGAEDAGKIQADERPQPMKENEREALAQLWQQRVAGAAQTALQAGKLNSAMARMIDHLLEPQLPWRALLDRYLTTTAHNDYDYMRPSNRREGDAIMPSLRSNDTDVVVALDTSGSIKDEELAEFAAEINAIKGQVSARITLLACAADLSEECPWTFESWEPLSVPNHFNGGGGTSFLPVFDWVTEHGRQPDLLIYFTDGKGDFPDIEPDFPTLWLVKGPEPVPWGRRIQLN